VNGIDILEDMLTEKKNEMGGPELNTIKEEHDGTEKEEGEYELRWSEHNAQIISVFYQLSQTGEFTDVTISTEDHQFKAHKLVLSACSPYFRQLFSATPCEHPVVFLKDVPDNHMRLLLEYMYLGSISVRQCDLEEILRTAAALEIRGLTTAQVPPLGLDETTDTDDTPLIVDEKPLVVDESGGGSDSYHNVETLSSHSATSGKSSACRRGAEGRKSSAPKKLRLSGDDSLISPRNWHPEVATDLRVSPFAAMSERSPDTVSSDQEDRMSLKTEDHMMSDQPVDFSTSGPGKIDIAPQYSILGSYLKAGGRAASTTPPHDAAYDARMRMGLAEDLRRAGYGNSNPWMNSLEQLSSLSSHMGSINNHMSHRPASRDSRGDSREERNSSGDDHEKESKGSRSPPLGTLPETLGIDIASRIRSHFMNPSYAWLNGMSGMSSLASMSPLGSMGSLNSLSNLANRPKESRRGSVEKPDKQPLGGIRTGEIGTNGKPSVECEVCGKRLADPSSLYRHRKIHSGDKPHKCPFCSRRFIQRYNMKQHVKTHKGAFMDLENQSSPSLIPQNLTIPQNLSNSSSSLNLTT